jgi:hypothetical protein
MRRSDRWLSALVPFVLLVTCGVASGAEVATPGAAAGSWIDARPGEAVTDVRARLGDPLRRELADDVFASRYAIARFSAYATLYEKSDRVVEIRVVARSGDAAPNVTDPFGVSLGASYDALKTKRGTPAHNATQGHDYVAGYDNSDGTRSLYEFSSEKVVAIELLMTLESIAKLPSPAPFVEHTGDSIAHAIVDVQASDQDSTAWEYLYLAYHPCSGDDRWKIVKQALHQERSRAYDILEVTCPANGDQRSFFFDITAGFGKP